MPNSIIEFLSEEKELLILAFERRIQMTEQDFLRLNGNMSKSVSKYIIRYKEVLLKIPIINEYSDKEKLAVVSCTNEILSDNSDLNEICKSILKKCGYPKKRKMQYWNLKPTS